MSDIPNGRNDELFGELCNDCMIRQNSAQCLPDLQCYFWKRHLGPSQFRASFLTDHWSKRLRSPIVTSWKTTSLCRRNEGCIVLNTGIWRYELDRSQQCILQASGAHDRWRSGALKDWLSMAHAIYGIRVPASTGQRRCSQKPALKRYALQTSSMNYKWIFWIMLTVSSLGARLLFHWRLTSQAAMHSPPGLTLSDVRIQYCISFSRSDRYHTKKWNADYVW